MNMQLFPPIIYRVLETNERVDELQVVIIPS